MGTFPLLGLRLLGDRLVRRSGLFGYDRVRLRATSGRNCSEAMAFFIAQPLGAGENPNRARLRLHAALGQLRHQTAQRER